MSCLTILKEKGLRLTPQRRLIIDMIHSAETHLTAEDIIAYVQERMPGVNKSTIYRTLEVLEETGCVYKSESNDRFIYHHAEDGHHHHMVCTACGKTIECPESIFLPVEKSLKDKFGFHTSFKHMVVEGLCADCKKRK